MTDNESTRKICRTCMWFKASQGSDAGRCFRFLKVGADGVLAPVKAFATWACYGWARSEEEETE